METFFVKSFFCSVTKTGQEPIYNFKQVHPVMLILNQRKARPYQYTGTFLMALNDPAFI